MNNCRASIPGSVFGEYFIAVSGGDSLLNISLSGITYPNPHYEIKRRSSAVYVFEYVIGGTGIIQHGKSVFEVKAGDAYILAPNTFHHYRSNSSDPMEKIWFNASGSLISDLLKLHKLDGIHHIPNFKDKSLFDEILKAAEDGGDVCRKAAPLLHSLISGLSDFYYNSLSNPAQIMKDYIQKNINRRITEEELCDLTSYSKSAVIDIFKKEFKITPCRYIITSKIQNACTLLELTNLKIKDIALRLGFDNPHNFSTLFKKEKGITPLKYRTIHQVFLK